MRNGISRTKWFSRMMAAPVLLCGVAMSPGVQADERLETLAVGGDWHAFAHYPSTIPAPDLCMVANPKGQAAFRSDAAGQVEMRVVNFCWSLPPDIQGAIRRVRFKGVGNDTKWPMN